MEVSITNLMNKDECQQWIEEYFHPEALKCPRCGAGRDDTPLLRSLAKVAHRAGEWAHDDDGDGLRESTIAPLKAYGPMYATSYALQRGTSSGISSSVSFGATSNAYRLNSSRPLVPFHSIIHEPLFLSAASRLRAAAPKE